MANRLLSIELGLNKIKLCVLTYNHKSNSMHLEWECEEDTPKGTVTANGIYEIDSLAVKIHDILSENNIKVKNCIFVANASNIYSQVVELPEQKNGSEYLELITARAEQENLFPVSMKQQVLTYTLVDSFSYEMKVQLKKSKKDNKPKKEKTKKAKKYTSVAYLAPEGLVLNYLELAKILKLRVRYIDYVGNSVYNIVNKNYKDNSYVLIHLADFNCFVSIVEDGHLKKQRVLDFNLTSLGERIMLKDTLFKCKTLEEAFDFINMSQFLEESYKLPDYNDGYSELDLDDIERLRDELLADIEKLFNGIESFISFYRKDGNDISNIILVNQGYSITSLQDSISELLSRPVDSFDLNKYIKSKKKDVSLNNFIGCIGSIINPTNFNIESAERERINQMVGKIVAGTLIGSVWISCLLVGFTIINHEQLKMENEDLQRKIIEAEEARSIYNRWQESTNNLGTAKEFDEESSTVLNDLDLLLEKISSILPTKKCKIDSFNASLDSLSFTVMADSKDTFAALLEDLYEFEEFENVEINGVTEAESDDFKSGITVTGAITCSFKQEEEDVPQNTASEPIGEGENGEENTNSANGAGQDFGEGDSYGQVTDIESELDYNNGGN